MLHTLSTHNVKKKRVGRGGARGKRAGRGHKGQKSRAGRNIRPAMRDELQRIPKKRGHNKNRARGVNTGKAVQTVTLTMLEKNFTANETVSPSILLGRGIVSQCKGRVPKVKIVARGEITVPLNIRKVGGVSEMAKEQIVKAGGKIQ